MYFADAHSPWQRGHNDNGNRQLRYWLPKGTDLRSHSQADLDPICDVLNTQPRRSRAGSHPTTCTLPMPRARTWNPPTADR